MKAGKAKLLFQTLLYGRPTGVGGKCFCESKWHLYTNPYWLVYVLVPRFKCHYAIVDEYVLRRINSTGCMSSVHYALSICIVKFTRTVGFANFDINNHSFVVWCPDSLCFSLIRYGFQYHFVIEVCNYAHCGVQKTSSTILN